MNDPPLAAAALDARSWYDRVSPVQEVDSLDKPGGGRSRHAQHLFERRHAGQHAFQPGRT